MPEMKGQVYEILIGFILTVIMEEEKTIQIPLEVKFIFHEIIEVDFLNSFKYLKNIHYTHKADVYTTS